MLSSREQTKVKIRVPADVPRGTRICIEDADESDMDIHQSKENEKKAKEPGNGTQEPKKKTARDRDPRTREKEHGQQQEELAQSKWNAQTRTAQSSSSLSLQWWTRCTASRRSCARRREMCEKSGVTSEQEGHDVENDVAEETMSAMVKLAKETDEPYDISQPRKLVTQRDELRPVHGRTEDAEERVTTSHTEKCEKSENCAKESPRWKSCRTRKRPCLGV